MLSHPVERVVLVRSVQNGEQRYRINIDAEVVENAVHEELILRDPGIQFRVVAIRKNKAVVNGKKDEPSPERRGKNERVFRE
jgi:hypothetical protein